MNDHLIYDSYDVQIGSVGAKLYQHINNDDIHLSEEDRQKLDSIKLNSSDSEDGTTIGNLQIELNNKADKDDIPTKVSQLENDLNFLSEIPDYYTTEEEVKLLIEELAGSGGGSGDNPDLSDIQDQIDELTRLVNQYGITIEQLRQLIEENTSDITNLEETIQNIEQNIINLGDRITNIEEGGGGGSYELPVATGTRLGGVKIGSGIDVTDDGTISVASSGGGGEGGLTPGDMATLDKRYLRKDTDDETTHSITVPKLLSENFLSGIDGTGFYLGNKAYDGKDTYSHLEIDNLLVRNKAIFEELEIRKLSYVNGNIVLSAAGGTIESVEDQGTSWKCYLKSDDGTTATTNTFQVNDLVRCETFDIKEGVYEGVSNKFYWRQVIEVGEDGNKNYIVLDKSNCASGSDEPEAGDVIVQFGNSDDEQTNRQNIIIISATDEDSPSIKMYSRVISYDLNDAVLNSIISPGQVAFRTNLFRLISGDSYNPVCVDRGEYNPSTVYNYWDRVSYQGSLYLNVYQEGTTQGIAPGNTTYWMLQVEKGDKGDKGEAGDPGPQGPQGPPGESTDLGYGYTAYATPSSVIKDYTTQFDSEGRIQSFSLADIKISISVFKNGDFVTDAVAYVDEHTDTDKVRIAGILVGGKKVISSITPEIVGDTGSGTARFTISFDNNIGYTDEQIPTDLVHDNGTLYWPHTSLQLAINVLLPEKTESQTISVPINLNIVGASSFWEVTADHWVSRFGQIEGNFANYSTIEQTAEAISASVTEINGELDTIRQSIADITAGQIDFSVIANEMRKAGINISLDKGADTGTVQIYGDKVTIKNRENGDDVLWVEDETAKMSNVDIVGGTIGGYNIENNKIHSSSTSGTINIDVDSIELKSKSTINDEFSNPYPVSQIRMSSSYKEDQGVSLGGHVYSSLLVRAQHSGTNGIHTGIFIDAAKTDNIDMYGIASYLPSSLYGIQNYGGEQYLWLPLTNNKTISLNIRESSKYIYYGSSNISITLPIPRTNYLDSNTIQIFVATQSNVTVNGSGCKIMYNKYNTEKATSVGLNHWGIYTFVYIGGIIGDGSNYWVCTYNAEVFK